MASLGVATLGSEFDQSGMEDGLNNAQSFTQKFLGTWQGAFSAAMGFIIRDVIMGLGRAIVDLGKDALSATAEWESMGLSMQSLVARELRAADSTLTMSDALTKASGRTKELLDWIQKLAIQSPFDVKSVQSAFQTALAYGFTTEQAQKLTSTMIDFAAATGKDAGVMNQVSLALGQIRAKGKLAGQEILQLVNAGVPVNAILTEMGYTIDDVSRGIVKADDFIGAFTKTLDHDFGGAAARQTETWTGLLNSFGDIKKIGLRTLFDGVFKALQPVAVTFATWLQGPGMVILERMGRVLGNIVQGFVDIAQAVGRFQFFFSNLDKGMSVAGALHRLFPDLNLDGAVSKKFIDFLENIIPTVKEIIKFVDGIGESFDGVVKRAKFFFTNLQKGMSFEGAVQRLLPEIDVKGLIKGISNGLKALGGGAVATALGVAGASIGGEIVAGIATFFASAGVQSIIATAVTGLFSTAAGQAVMNAIVDMVAGAMLKAPWLAALAPALGPLATALSGFVAFLAPILLIAGAIMLVVGAFQMFQSGQLAKPIADIQAAFASMGQTFALIMPTLEKLGGQIWQGFLDSSKQLADQVVPWLVTQFEKLAKWFNDNRPLIEKFFGVIADFITKNLLPAIAGMWQFIAPILTGLIDLILGLAKIIMQVATGDWAGAWATIQTTVGQVAGAIGAAIMGFFNWIANIFGSSLAGIQATWSANWAMFIQIITTVWGMIVTGISTWLTGIWTNIVNAFNAVVAYINAVWNAVLFIISQVWQNIQITVATALTNLIAGILGFVNPIITNIQTLFNSAVTRAKEIVGKFSEVATAIIDGIKKGLESGGQSVIDAITKLVQDAIKAAMGALDAHSPSQVFTDIGGYVSTGLANGITNFSGNAVAAAALAASSLAQAMSASLASINVLAANTLTMFNASMATMVSSVTFAWSNILLITQTSLMTIYNFIVYTFTTWVIYFTNIWLTITNITNLAWFLITSIIIGALTGLSVIIIGFAKPIADSIQALFASAISSAISLAKGFMSVGKSIADGIAAGINAGMGAIVDAIKSVIDAAISAAMSALDAHSPSVVFTNIGSYVPSGLSLGITDNIGQAVKAVEKASLQVGMAAVPAGMGGTGPAIAPGSFALAGTGQAPAQSIRQNNFYAPVYVGKLSDLEDENSDPLKNTKVD